MICSMKNLILFLLINVNIYSQPIDYDNFDNKTAEKFLFETFLKFRDTITRNGNGLLYSDWFPLIPNFKEKMKLYWSDKVYNLISKPNTEEVVRQNRLHHVDRESWWNATIDNKKLFVDDIYIKYNTPFEKPVRLLTYSENGVSSNVKYKTYQEMATAMILCWESSANHRCAQRAPLFSIYPYEKYGDKNVIIKSQSACCVRYAHGKLWAFINFIY